ncbi:hypothetical protein ABT120_56645 [Nonomuraea angiospora]|uniref:hypothetical protein n=1 Tax=Nonomuraea angiospora TaxID=46172 RepID=UPI00332AEEC1
MLLGRRTYEEHVGYWPAATGGLADRMNDIRKVVFSATLPALEWRLLDELRLLIDPVVVREGRKLFEDDGDRLTCTLLASHSYRTGTVSAAYAVAG